MVAACLSLGQGRCGFGLLYGPGLLLGLLLVQNIPNLLCFILLELRLPLFIPPHYLEAFVGGGRQSCFRQIFFIIIPLPNESTRSRQAGETLVVGQHHQPLEKLLLLLARGALPETTAKHEGWGVVGEVAAQPCYFL